MLDKKLLCLPLIFYLIQNKHSNVIGTPMIEGKKTSEYWVSRERIEKGTEVAEVQWECKARRLVSRTDRAFSNCQYGVTLPLASNRCRPVTRRTALTSVPLVALVSLRAASRDVRRILTSLECDDRRWCTPASSLLHRAVSRVIVEERKVRIDGTNRPNRSLVWQEVRVVSLSLRAHCTHFIAESQRRSILAPIALLRSRSGGENRGAGEHPSRASKRRRVTIGPLLSSTRRNFAAGEITSRE